MPAIIVQGKKGHMGHCYQGFSALGILAEIYLKTNGSLEFSEVYGDEASPPSYLGKHERYEESIRRVDSSQRIRILHGSQLRNDS